MKKMLILGGTAEARELAGKLVTNYGEALDITTALAGATQQAPALPGKTRVGGFGGASGLTAYLIDNAVDLLVDATHPFARVITANAALAAHQAGVKRLRLERPAWQMPDGLDSIFVPDMAEAAAIVARTAKRVFLTIGSRDIEAFRDITNVHFLVRLIATPATPPPLVDYELITGRPPFDVSAEASLLRGHNIDTLVAKASGGNATFAKIEAAARVQARALLVRRPPPPPGAVAWGVDAALSWVRENL